MPSKSSGACRPAVSKQQIVTVRNTNPLQPILVLAPALECRCVRLGKFIQAVAPIVGRADLLCGLLSVIALSLTITTTTGGRQGRVQASVAAAYDRAGKTLPGAAPELTGQEDAPVAAVCTVSEKSMLPPPAHLAPGAKTDASKNHAGKAKGGKANQRATGRDKSTPRQGKAGKSSSLTAKAHSPPRSVDAPVVKAEIDTGPGMGRFLAALGFAVGATLCKEIGITVVGLMAGGEVVRLFEEHDRQQQRRQPRRSNVSTASSREVLQNQVVLQPWWCGFVVRPPVAAVARIASALTCAASLVGLHVRLREGAGVREWGVLENDIAILERWALEHIAHSIPNAKQEWNKCSTTVGTDRH